MYHDTIINELIRRGVTYFVISPGSRSTPLTLAVARHPAAHTVIAYDERGGAYHAVGYARATGRPAVLICTSGTAAANYLPAIAEASNDALPLIALTADRPPELHDIGANQTMDQQNLYGSFARQFINLPPQEADLPDSAALEAVTTALDRCLGPLPGPVHINCMFREPFDLAATPDAPAAPPTERVAASVSGPAVDEAALSAALDAMAGAQRGMVVAGYLPSEADRRAVVALADTLGWPVWADIRSGLHNLSPFVSDLCALRERLTRPGAAPASLPDCVIHLGGNVVSKPLVDMMRSRFNGTYVKLPGTTRSVDPTTKCSLSVAGDLALLCAAIAQRGGDRRTSALAVNGVEAFDRLQKRLYEAAQPDARLTEPTIASLLSRDLSDDVGLVIGNSMPVRFCDRFALYPQLPARVAANRGVSGIDGTIATAIGFSAGLDRPVVCVLGDLTFIHDMSSLTQLVTAPHPLLFVVVNNRGGGIFHHLPIAQQSDVFEPFFVTPHTYNFEAIARQFALAYSRAETNGAFIEQLEAALASPAHAVLELTVDQDANMKAYRDIGGQP
ncbi:MAG: 2-succinyl-5-enolpyruvyl-6-hydroxy-3-cyclohexene-1-carboxylic-acid synthase [Lentisphaerae bacterium]|nr:2-succinyl-5-enolpyruvyl-6-hydroxy-3-cyclohexene-1-carboxylic-acid synthase [Lentisphaerota bacterium]